jgi:hypothetical protein
MQMPKGAKILDLQFIRDEAYFFALVDPEERTQETRYFFTVMTADVFPDNDNLVYRGNYHTDNDIFHVFEAIPL